MDEDLYENEDVLEEEDEEEEDPDAIVYTTPAVKKRKNAPRGQGLGKPMSAIGVMGKGKPILPPIPAEEDEIMPDLEDEDLDIDADGEDE